MMTLMMCLVLTAASTDTPSGESLNLNALAACDFKLDLDESATPIHLAALPEEPVAQPFGMEESTYWLLNVAGGTDGDSDTFLRIGGGISYFLIDDFSMDFELNGGWIRTDLEDAFAANFNLLFRWHFWHDDARTWSIYADGGAGMLVASEEVPAGGSNFNFTPQMGMGASFDIGNNNRLFIGARWFHISNARLYSDNPGQDYGMLYAMLAWPF